MGTARRRPELRTTIPADPGLLIRIYRDRRAGLGARHICRKYRLSLRTFYRCLNRIERLRAGLSDPGNP